MNSNENLKKRVLLVDDDSDTLTILSSFFSKAGADVVAVDDSSSALDEFMKHSMNTGKFDLIALDIRMPKVNGNTLAQQLRDKGYRGTIVAMTAAATGAGRNESKASGFDRYIGKSELKKDVIAALLADDIKQE